MTRHPAAYLRKSKDATTKGEHLAALMALVHADGHNGDTEVYDDWARSGGRSGLGRRSEWRRLCDAIERDEVEAVYMNDLDRGGRDLEEWLRFLRVAQERGVRVLDRTGEWTTPARRTEFVFKAWLAEEEYRRAKERSAFTKRMGEKRGDQFGYPRFGYTRAREEGTGRVVHVPNPDEPIGPVLDVVRETRGNVLAACRLLNARGIRARRGLWSPRTLANVVRREAPRLLRQAAPARMAKDGLRQPAPLSRLVRCHCGHLMTPRAASKGLYCGQGIKLGTEAHGRYVARDRHVFDLLRAETEGRREERSSRTFTNEPGDAVARRDALEEELRRLGRAYRAGAVPDQEFDAEGARIRSAIDELADLAAEDEELVSIRVSLQGPVVDWALLDTDPAALGDQLRRAFREVRLDKDLLPVEAVRR